MRDAAMQENAAQRDARAAEDEMQMRIIEQARADAKEMAQARQGMNVPNA